MKNMNQDYYTLDNGKSAVDYVYEYSLGFAYGNAFKYLVRHSRKPGNTAESDLNKALNYILSANNENSLFKRLVLRVYNTWKFNSQTQFASRNLADILCAIIRFESNTKIAKMIIKYMDNNSIKVKDEYRKH